MRRLAFLMAVVLVATGSAFGGLERGNRLYRSGQYAEAVEAYRAALESGNDSPALRYNLGTALLQLGRYEEAERELRAALAGGEPELREVVQYNLGQRFLQEARGAPDPEAATALYDAALEAYRETLRLRPDDADAKWNYELALRERDQQEQQAGGGGEEGGEGEGEQDEEEQDAGAGSGGEARASAGESELGGEGGGQAPMSQEQAEQILSAVEQDERELFQERLRRGRQDAPTARDW